MKQGVNILPLGEDGRGIRVSNNVPWYQEYYKEHGKAPNQAQLRDLAYLLTVGDASAPNVEGWIPTTRETAEAMDAARGELDELNGHIQTLENIKERMMKVDSFEVKGSVGLSPEGYKLYRQIMEMLEKIGGEQKEDKQTKVARMNAMLFAHHADIFAAAMRTQEGKEKYTALDYFKDRFALRYGGTDMREDAEALHQAANADGKDMRQVHEVTKIKTALVNLARAAWSDKKAQGKVSFKPSQKLRDKVRELFGHDIDEVFITADDMRHIKNAHSEDEEKHGQVNLTPEDISEVYHVVNEFDSATKERDDRRGNQNILVVKDADGRMFALLVERGKNKAEIKTVYKHKKPSPMSDAISPNLNARSDSAKVSSASNIAQAEAEGKIEDITYIDTVREENQSFYQSAWHGSPRDFNGVDLGGIGTDANIYHQINSLDNGNADGDNESRISDAVFQKYLNDGIMEMVRDRVSAEIGEYVDLSVMSDPVERDSARDRLPYIRKMLADYNTNTIQNKPAYRDRLAVKIEYARRCFDNDPRVQHGTLRQVDGHERPQDIHRTGQAALPGRNDGRGVGEAGRHGTRGVSRAVSGERSGARAHFDKLYNDMQKHLESQGAFSMLNQVLRQEVRGEISKEDGKRIITLFESADESTFLHEMGHMFLISRSLSYFINLL